VVRVAASRRRGAALEKVGGRAPVVSGGDELDDDARERVAMAMASAACTNACRSNDEE
jgi:hypothetical protein